ncbi:flagellar biosynthesis anti-sigma factor FlgM [Piscinibacter sp.]|jgi:negative regulator of flagellin synthesis FlgM|uniref:flagellar biosynthesis anti-sigma factor FlgM n=1 Tax=Piscinibacter sp. TaxID=1903157 RepID=UPI003559F6A6
MKIGNPPEKPALVPATAGRATPGEAGKATATPAGAEASAQVELSNTAATLMSGVGGATPEFDAEKVARIAQAIADGTFTVNPEAIADKLIANAQELLGKASR